MAKKVLLVASHGGHWVQLRRIAPAFEGMEVVYVSTNASLQSEVAPLTLLVVPDAHLDEKLAVVALAYRMLKVILGLRPDVVVSTGAAPGFFALMFGKLFGAKTIWLDSVANVDKMSVSGQKVKYFADLWLTQWEHLATEVGPQYKGAVI